MKRQYLAQTRGEDYNLIQLSHLLEEIIDTRTFDHVNIMPVVLNLYRDDVVRMLDRLQRVSFFGDWEKVKPYLEATVEQCLIKIKDKTFTASMLRGERR